MASYVHLPSEPDLTEPDIIICSVETSYGVSVHKVLGSQGSFVESAQFFKGMWLAVFMTNRAANVVPLL